MIDAIHTLIKDVILPISPIIMLFIVYDIMEDKKDNK
jgi:hypothetical protein